MIRKTGAVAALALAAGFMATGVALAQTRTGNPAPPVASARSAPSPAQSTPPWVQYEQPTIKPLDRDISQPTYSVDQPPSGPSGIYLPAVILGYAKSATGCVVIGCEDGPQVGGSSGPPSAGSTEPQPANPGLSGPR